MLETLYTSDGDSPYTVDRQKADPLFQETLKEFVTVLLEVSTVCSSPVARAAVPERSRRG